MELGSSLVAAGAEAERSEEEEEVTEELVEAAKQKVIPPGMCACDVCGELAAHRRKWCLSPDSNLRTRCRCPLRYTQLCTKDVPRRRRFHEQATRAGKLAALERLESENHALCQKLPNLSVWVYALAHQAVYLMHLKKYIDGRLGWAMVKLSLCAEGGAKRSWQALWT